MTRLGLAARTSFFYGFQPLSLVLVFVLWWILPMRADSPLETAVALLLVVNLIVYLLEHVAADRTDWVTDGNDRKIDAFWVGARVLVFGPLLQLALILTIEPFANTVNVSTLWPSSSPLFVRILLALLLGELIAFLLHVAMHRVPILWRYHATHHAPTKLTAARWAINHPFDTALVQLPLFFLVTILNVEIVDIAGAFVIGRMTVIVAHSNLRLNSAGIGWILTTPDLHRRHHGLGAKDQANFGDVFVLFDRVWGSFSDRKTDKIGIGSGDYIPLRKQLTLRGIDLSAQPK